mmetsp:Transcript_20035/g.61724  ORF Transcript_20035/g.61724 Transcript_20035/m.61724 type:complete len:89 (+) Transcript_20035:147-413(+)
MRQDSYPRLARALADGVASRGLRECGGLPSPAGKQGVVRDRSSREACRPRLRARDRRLDESSNAQQRCSSACVKRAPRRGRRRTRRSY